MHSERRRHNRVNLYLPLSVCEKDGSGLKSEEKTWTVNIGETGIYFITRREYPVGASLCLRFERGIPAGEPLWPGECVCEAEVVHVTDFRGIEEGSGEVLRGVGAIFRDGSWLPFLARACETRHCWMAGEAQGRVPMRSTGGTAG